MLALLTRRKAAPLAAPQQDATTRPGTVMQFLTQGGADVDLFPVTWTIRFRDTDVRRDYSGFQWICRGCHIGGKDHRLGWGYDEIAPCDSRQEANEHAAGCHAKPNPKPTA